MVTLHPHTCKDPTCFCWPNRDYFVRKAWRTRIRQPDLHSRRVAPRLHRWLPLSSRLLTSHRRRSRCRCVGWSSRLLPSWRHSQFDKSHMRGTLASVNGCSWPSFWRELVRETKGTVRANGQECFQEYLLTGSSKVTSCGTRQTRIQPLGLLQ